MSPRLVNLSLLVLVQAEIVSGLASFLVGAPDERWVFWLHAAGGLTVAVLLPWKTVIALRSFSRRDFGAWTALPLLLSLLLVAALASGVLWSSTGLPDVPTPGFGSVSGLTLHVAVALATLPLLVLHAALRWFPPRADDFLARRNALRALAAGLAGIAAWRASEALTSLASLPGASRRFTGSREEGSFTGNGHPVTNWFLDRTQRIDESKWRLRVHGRVGAEVVLTYEDLRRRALVTRRALLDCTGGWYTVQDWMGVPLADLLAEARTSGEARSFSVQSVTGYSRRFGLGDADELLLALQVGGERLAAVHGFPARLVAPGRRGYNWVKWVESIEVDDQPAILQPPLPLQ